MEIDFNATDILPLKWWYFTHDVLRDKKFDSDEFISLFKETFEVLRNCPCEETIKKELIELIKDMSGFVSTRFAKINYEHLAACELTDAMLTNCLQSETVNKPIKSGKWTLLTCEIDVNFLAPETELFKFTLDLEKWDENDCT